MGRNFDQPSTSGFPMASQPRSSHPLPGSLIYDRSLDGQDLYLLPPRSVADRLVEIYRQRVHSIYKVIHWPTFRVQYEQTFMAGAPIDKHWFGVLNQIFAIACLLGGREVYDGKEAEAAMKFYQRSLSIMFPLILATDSLQALQCLVLMVSTC